jgi:hypothetical protein
MTRHLFGAGPASWTFNNTGSATPMVGGAVVQAFNAQTGGTQYTDLSLDAEGNLIVDHVTSSDASDGLQLGQIPPFYGPDDVFQMWLSADGGPRVLAVATNLGDDVATQAGAIQSLDNQITALQDSIATPNGLAHLDANGLLDAASRWTPQFSFANATDANLSSPSNNDTLIYSSSSSKWVLQHDTAWTNLSLGSGFSAANGTTPKYRKSRDGRMLYLTGQVGRSPVANGSGITCATLPSGFRPTTAQSYPVASALSTYTTVRADFHTDGTIVLWCDSSYTPSWASFDGTILALD